MTLSNFLAITVASFFIPGKTRGFATLRGRGRATAAAAGERNYHETSPTLLLHLVRTARRQGDAKLSLEMFHFVPS